MAAATSSPSRRGGQPEPRGHPRPPSGGSGRQPPAGAAPRPRAGRAGRGKLTPDDVIDAALELTRQHGVDGWTIRDLAAALGTWPNTIAHHVGDREAILDAVMHRVVALMPNPSADLAWQDWFRALLYPGREIISAYPGVARRLVRDGASVPAALPIMDRGIGLLTQAGFGERAPLAYSVLLNSAILLIALDDDRKLTGQGRGDAAAGLLSMPAPPQAGVGWAAMRTWLQHWATDPDASRDLLYRYTVEALLTGIESDLTTGLATES